MTVIGNILIHAKSTPEEAQDYHDYSQHPPSSEPPAHPPEDEDPNHSLTMKTRYQLLDILTVSFSNFFRLWRNVYMIWTLMSVPIRWKHGSYCVSINPFHSIIGVVSPKRFLNESKTSLFWSANIPFRYSSLLFLIDSRCWPRYWNITPIKVSWLLPYIRRNWRNWTPFWASTHKKRSRKKKRVFVLFEFDDSTDPDPMTDYKKAKRLYIYYSSADAFCDNIAVSPSRFYHSLVCDSITFPAPGQ